MTLEPDLELELIQTAQAPSRIIQVHREVSDSDARQKRCGRAARRCQRDGLARGLEADGTDEHFWGCTLGGGAEGQMGGRRGDSLSSPSHASPQLDAELLAL